MLDIQRSSQFKKDYKKAIKKGLDVSELKTIVEKLQK